MGYQFGRFRDDREKAADKLRDSNQDRLARKVERGECLSWSERNRVRDELERSRDHYGMSNDFRSCECD